MTDVDLNNVNIGESGMMNNSMDHFDATDYYAEAGFTDADLALGLGIGTNNNSHDGNNSYNNGNVMGTNWGAKPSGSAVDGDDRRNDLDFGARLEFL